MRVLIEMVASERLRAAFSAEEPVHALATAAEDLTSHGVTIDSSFEPVPVRAPASVGHEGLALDVDDGAPWTARPESTYLVRGTISDVESTQRAYAELSGRPAVAGVFSDPVIESCVICPGDPPKGSHRDVARKLGSPGRGHNGDGVLVAVVDTGINTAHLENQGKPMKLDARKSFTPSGVSSKPGRHPVGHGTMCAFDVGIAAPEATLLDHAVLLSQTPGRTAMEGLLSDAVRSYDKLHRVLARMPSARRRLVVSNSWGMFNPAWDFPPGHPGNYSDNPHHPFNLIVASLEAAGADILFAAGNCGRDCPDGRCRFGSTRPVCGANSHPAVMSVAGVDVRRRRVGYSSQGPGRLSPRKPDISGYTHFRGSDVYPADGGTSAACPVVAGAVAAVRTKHAASKISPAEMRSLAYKTAHDLGTVGYDRDHGWGAVNLEGLARAAERVRTRRRSAVAA